MFWRGSVALDSVVANCSVLVRGVVTMFSCHSFSCLMRNSPVRDVVWVLVGLMRHFDYRQHWRCEESWTNTYWRGSLCCLRRN
jgi:hypothetical protein